MEGGGWGRGARPILHAIRGNSTTSVETVGLSCNKTGTVSSRRFRDETNGTAHGETVAHRVPRKSALNLPLCVHTGTEPRSAPDSKNGCSDWPMLPQSVPG